MISIAEYIKYRSKAKRRHGIHSPFIYRLASQCLRTRMDPESAAAIEQVCTHYSKDERIIEINDFGAGSKRLKTSRKVRKIYSMCSTKGKYGQLLYQLSRHFRPMRVLEFGTSLGIGTTHLFYGSPDSEIITVEACGETRKLALECLPPKIKSIESTFDDYLSTLSDERFDFIFIDGHHNGEALLNYVHALKSRAHAETIFLLDDIRWSLSMRRAWNSIINDPEFHVTIDFFRMGMVLLRPQQEKEHFSLKF